MLFQYLHHVFMRTRFFAGFTWAQEDASKPTALLAGEELDHQLEKLFQEEATEDGDSWLTLGAAKEDQRRQVKR